MKRRVAAVVTGAVVVSAPAFAADGMAVYSKACAACHTALSPKLGDKRAWAPRIAAGVDAMVATAIKGKGAMPPRGGNAALTDADIRAAVEYMVSKAK